MTRAIGYLRVSTEEQALGPEAQRASILAYAKARGLEVGSWHADLGVSGTTPIPDRPGLLAALDALKVHMPLLRNRLVMLLSSQDFEALKTPVGKEMLRQQATASVQELAQKEIGKLAIEQVLFTNFVLQ